MQLNYFFIELFEEYYSKNQRMSCVIFYLFILLLLLLLLCLILSQGAHYAWEHPVPHSNKC